MERRSGWNRRYAEIGKVPLATLGFLIALGWRGDPARYVEKKPPVSEPEPQNLIE